MTVKLALLGAGRIGQAHSRAIAQIPGAELVAVSDVNIDAASAIAHQHGCATASLDAIAKDPNINGVLICTPTDLHAEQIEKFVTAGKAVFCEKPIDLDSARVKACLEVVKAHQGFLMIGFNRRFDHILMLFIRPFRPARLARLKWWLSPRAIPPRRRLPISKVRRYFS